MPTETDDWRGLRHTAKSEDGRLIITASQNVQSVLDANAEHRASGKRDGELRLVARLPIILVELWSKQLGVNYHRLSRHEQAEVTKRFLNSNEWYKLKAMEGTV